MGRCWSPREGRGPVRHLAKQAGADLLTGALVGGLLPSPPPGTSKKKRSMRARAPKQRPGPICWVYTLLSGYRRLVSFICCSCGERGQRNALSPQPWAPAPWVSSGGRWGSGKGPDASGPTAAGPKGDPAWVIGPWMPWAF